VKYTLSILLISLGIFSHAQKIAGTVRDAISLDPLIGATISISAIQSGQISDVDGTFEIDNLSSGRYSLIVSFVGYKTQQISEVWVKNGKVTTLDVLLERSASDLQEVAVYAKRATITLGKIGITEEQINRYAASYNDPARVIIASPDLAVTNDQNNLISVRGLSPSLNIWKLEGSEIVNPNHLSNAGTFLDQPTATGGGVNILSAQMLDRSQFLYGGFSVAQGNATAGVFDMNIKKGASNRQYTAQASLIGLDFATEGALSKNDRTTYAANYRYSFTGLLAQFGVDFGGEEIGFQDLSLSVNTQIGEKTELKFFALGGASYNDFEKPETIERAKDRGDINYDSRMGAVGTSFRTGLENGHIGGSLVYSGVENLREAETVDSLRVFIIGLNEGKETFFEDQQSTLSFNGYWMTRMFSSINSSMGLMANQYFYTAETRQTYLDGIVHESQNVNGSINQYLWRPYWNLSGVLIRNISWMAGIAMSIIEDQTKLEPRASLTYSLAENHSLTASYGLYNQLQRPFNFYFDQTPRPVTGTTMGFLESQRFLLNYAGEVGNISASSELFYYLFPKVYVYDPLLPQEVETSSYGFSLSLNKPLQNGFYIQTGGSLFNSEIGNEESAYNTGYSVRLTSGKEWTRMKKEAEKRFGINLRGMVQGGRPLTVRSETIGSPFVMNEAYRTTPYLRLDLRMIWTKVHSNWTSSIALDLQNVLNRQNEAYRYYDTYTEQVDTQYQLGLIPILTYRVEW
jgi:hypothetical protein